MKTVVAGAIYGVLPRLLEEQNREEVSLKKKTDINFVLKL